MASRFPQPEDIPLPSIGGRPGIVQDRSGQIIAQGMSDLAEGVGSAARSLNRIHQEELKQQNVADISAAEAKWLEGSLAIENEFSERKDYQAFDDDAAGRITALKDEAAALIRDPKMRASWAGDVTLKGMVLKDRVSDLGRGLKREDDLSRFENSLVTNAKLLENPNVAPDVRASAQADMIGSLTRAMDTGLISTAEASVYRDKYLDAAEENLQINTLELEIANGNPEAVKKKLGVSNSTGAADVGAAVISTSGAPLSFPPAMAKTIALQLGDRALPSDPTAQAAYLKDPEINAKYASEAVDMMTARYNGDVTAAVISLAPGSSPELVREWISSKHDETKLPREVRQFYRNTMNAIKSPANTTHITTKAAPGIMVEDIDTGLLDRWETLQSVFGTQLTVISGKRDPGHNDDVGGAQHSQHLDGQAIDIDVKDLSEEDRLRLIESASAMGFGGIGVYDNSIHLDFGSRRGWGPSHSSDSIPAWAADVMARHQAGSITDIPGAISNVDPSASKISFDKRMALYNKAEQEADRRGIEKRAGIEVAVDNAPQAIYAQGTYDGYTPTAEDFVDAWGGAVGVEKWKAFSLAMEVAADSHSMKTMSMEDIHQLLVEKAPADTGDNASYEAKRYASLVEAAAAVKKERETDPAAAAIGAFPALEDAFADFGTSPEATEGAIAAMNIAQDKLGIPEGKKALLPKSITDKVLADYNDVTQPMANRIGGVVSAVFATNNPEQRRQLVTQLKAAGLPEYSDMVFDAMERGDEQASRYLTRALLTDPKDLPQDLGAKNSEIDQAIAEVFQQGQIGSIFYGLNGAPTDQNLRRAIDDTTLFKNAVKLRLADGSAKNLDDAVKLTTRDFFGDVKTAIRSGSTNSAGMQVTIPSDKDPNTYQAGFSMLLPQISEALHNQMTVQIAGLPESDGSLQVAIATRDNEIRMQLRNGRFSNAGQGQYQFLDMDGFAVVGADGQVLTFSDEEVQAAAAQFFEHSGAKQLFNYRQITGGDRNSSPERYYDIVGGQRQLTRDPFK